MIHSGITDGQPARRLDGPKQKAAPGVIPRLLTNARILELQRTAGNRAVSGLLTDFTVQRYEAGEHAKFGAVEGEQEKTVKVTSSDKQVVTMTYGEMMAMGDLFENFDQMQTVAAKELTGLLALIRKERDQGIGSVTEKEWNDATGGRYLKLAAKNAAHFAPPPGAIGFDAGGESNRHQWWLYQQRALGLSQRNKLDDALAINAFGDHFLTDAFSAGHLVNKREVMETARMNAFAKPNPRVPAPIQGFERQVAKGVLDSPKGAELMKYEANPGALSRWAPMSVDSLADVIDRIRFWEGDTFWSNFVKAVHDRLNQDIAIGGSGNKDGIEVTNKKNMTWRLSGDKTLSLSKKTLEIGREAVAQSRKNVTESAGKEKLDYMGLANAVWDYVPQLTDEGQKQVETIKKPLLDPSTTEAVDAWVAILIAPSNFAALETELVAKGMLRLPPAKVPARR
jgi:hypothetical protein